LADRPRTVAVGLLRRRRTVCPDRTDVRVRRNREQTIRAEAQSEILVAARVAPLVAARLLTLAAPGGLLETVDLLGSAALV
jgi:hypothetical protein